MLKAELEIKPVGEPNAQSLPEPERQTFFETFLARIKELNEKSE